MTVTAARLLDAQLGEFDPDVAAAIDAELARQRGTLEMISACGHAGAGLGADQQVRRGLPVSRRSPAVPKAIVFHG
jgi:hypothetical protein